jgi:CRISPR-associated helicase Cas3/CRISPR-associated endonuclease Cas3-HD
MEYFSRSPVNGIDEHVRDHLNAVRDLAGKFAAPWEGAAEAEIAGALHDIGKYGELFQDLLKHKTRHVDHWSAGAYLALLRYKLPARAIALAIQGHHVGLMQADKQQLNDSLTAATRQNPNATRQWAGNPPEELLQRWREDAGAVLPEQFPSLREAHAGHAAAQMLDVRMLFSVLVDADWLSAEAHENRDSSGPVYRRPGPALDESAALSALERQMAELRRDSKASAELQGARDFLFQSCWDAGSLPRGLFTLCAPTGSGKTMATLAFLLRQCEKHRLRRIIVVLPYLSILDQTVKAYRKVFQEFGVEYLIEDDSLAQDISGKSSLQDTSVGDRLRHLAQNWDAPVVVTTTVRFFDSLFSNRPADCRKLHSIAASAVLFDEAQTMLLKLAAPTLAAVAALTEAYGCTVLFSTATQPAFGKFDAAVREYAGVGWRPTPILDGGDPQFQALRRVRVEYHEKPESLEDAARRADGLASALFIVNKKAHAALLYQALREKDGREVLHLSTNMCPRHRRDTLQRVEEALLGPGCVLAATQCVEAGVDLDFPVLFRALAPLEALCQAAGRCNRNGRLPQGIMRVFVPTGDRLYPDALYAKGATLVAEMAKMQGAFPDIFDPEVIRRYYERFYARMDGEESAKNRKLLDALIAQDFEAVAGQYHWIDRGGANILVPYAAAMDDYERLAEQALNGWVTRQWFSRARHLTVSAFLSSDSAAEGWLMPVKAGKEVVPNWYVLANPKLYCPETGLDLSMADDLNNFTL